MGSACVLSPDRPQQCKAHCTVATWKHVYFVATRVSKSDKRYPPRIIRRSAIRLALITYPAGSVGAAATVVQSIAAPFGIRCARSGKQTSSQSRSSFCPGISLVLWSSVSWLFAKPGQHPRIRAEKALSKLLEHRAPTIAFANWGDYAYIGKKRRAL